MKTILQQLQQAKHTQPEPTVKIDKKNKQLEKKIKMAQLAFEKARGLVEQMTGLDLSKYDITKNLKDTTR